MALQRRARSNGRCLERSIIAFVFAAMLGGCATHTVEVKGEFPQPAMEPLPFHVALHLDDSLKSHIVRKEMPDGRTWEVSTGATHQTLFQQLAAGMFDETSAAAEPVVSDACVDAVLQPIIEDFGVTVPSQARGGLYEVQLRYRVRLYAPEGRLVADWALPGYAAIPPGTFQSPETSLKLAITEAMRDAAAGLVAGFSAQPRAMAFLARRRARAACAASAAGDRSDAESSPRC